MINDNTEKKIDETVRIDNDFEADVIIEPEVKEEKASHVTKDTSMLLYTREMDYVNNLGSEPLAKYRDCSKELASIMDGADINDDMMKTLNKILSGVDLNDLKFDSGTPKANKKGVFSSLTALAIKKIEKTVAKYTNISKEIEKLYVDFQESIYRNQQIGESLIRLRESYIETKNELIVAFEDGMKTYNEWRSEEDFTSEVFLNLDQKLRGMENTLMVIDQSIKQVGVLSESNTAIGLRLKHNYETVMPNFQEKITTFRTIRDQVKTSQSLDALEAVSNKLIQDAGKEMLEASKDIMKSTMSSHQRTREALTQSAKLMIAGTNELEQLRLKQASTYKDLKMLGDGNE